MRVLGRTLEEMDERVDRAHEGGPTTPVLSAAAGRFIGPQGLGPTYVQHVVLRNLKACIYFNIFN
jgi:hypothetical protein